MEFGPNGERFCEAEDEMGMGKVKRHFSYSSSSPSSSSYHYNKTELLPLSNNRWESQIYNKQRQMGSWLGNRYDLATATAEEDNSRSNEEAASTKVYLMETSPRNDEDVRSTSVGIKKEHMFDKVVTPSDVGKLNRLVIPKQHAEKYFPLDSSSNEKGLLLNFEDRNGKSWRFRYSYWNSSQSYVMTKGWSRFVKDKKLVAGDVVSFQRGVGELGKDRLFIDWRRSPDAPEPVVSFPLQHHLSFQRSISWNPLLMRPPLAAMARGQCQLSQMNNFYNRNSYYNGSFDSAMGSVLYLRSQPAATSVYPQAQMGMGVGMMEWKQQQQQQQHPIVFDSVPVVQGKAAAKRLRLFGVNMDCPVTESGACDVLSSTTIQNATMTIQPSQLSSSSQSPLQLRLYNGTPLPSALPPFDFLNKGKAPTSFDSNI